MVMCSGYEGDGGKSRELSTAHGYAMYVFRGAAEVDKELPPGYSWMCITPFNVWWNLPKIWWSNMDTGEFLMTFIRWNIYSALKTGVYARMYVIVYGRCVVHYSYVLPNIERMPKMTAHDREIGPCWTDDRHRRKGLYTYAIKRLCKIFCTHGAVYMLVKEDNIPSLTAIERCQPSEMFRGLERRRKGRLSLPRYALEWEAGDKAAERKRYNEAAASLLERPEAFAVDGSAGVPAEVRAAYIDFEAEIKRRTWQECRVLDLCGGTGLHSLTSARKGALVTVADIAEHSLEIARRRAAVAGVTIRTVVADAEALPFADGEFDVVTCAGSLSYADLHKMLNEVQRVLRPGGSFICEDALNHNVIYRFNRYVHYLRGHRSLSVIRRTPTRDTIEELERRFPEHSSTYYSGLLLFLFPLLRHVVGRGLAVKMNDWFDKVFRRWHRLAFRFVFAGSLPPSQISQSLDANVSS